MGKHRKVSLFRRIFPKPTSWLDRLESDIRRFHDNRSRWANFQTEAHQTDSMVQNMPNVMVPLDLADYCPN